MARSGRVVHAAPSVVLPDRVSPRVIGAARQATDAQRLMGFPDDAEELRKLLWGIEEHVDFAAADIDDVRELVQPGD